MTYGKKPEGERGSSSKEPYVITHRNAHDTELEAAESARKYYPKRALKVLDYLVRVNGDIDNHGHEAMGMIKDTYAPARNYLMREGYVENTGQRRLNERKRKCIVWGVTDRGLEHWRKNKHLLDEP